MEIINKAKRGRPATGRKADGSLFVRMPKEMVEGAKGVLKVYLAGGAISIPEGDKSGLNQKESVSGGPSGSVGSLELAGSGDRVKELESQLEKVMKDYVAEYERVKALEKEVAFFEKRREAWMEADPDEKVRWAVGEMNKLRKLIHKNEYDQTTQ